MKKIGIVTLYDINNYGNRLQNYAVQQILNKYIVTVETIINYTYDYENRNVIYFIKRMSFKKIINLLNRIFKKLYIRMFKNNEIQRRKELFLNFEKFISYSSMSLKNNMETKILNDSYDYFSIGSDQVWNPYGPAQKGTQFAMFAPKEKNISFSASFGVDNIPNEYIEIYKKGLNNLSAISVREERAVELVKEITGLEATLLVDPTMLLTAEEWNEVSKEPEYIPNKKYICTYFLGTYSKERRKYIYNLAKERDLEVVDLGQIKKPKYYTAGPSEFLWYIKNAEIMFTDSFHGTVFSLLYKRKFYVFDRLGNAPNMSSRIDSILKMFNLQDRRGIWDKIDFDSNIDFDKVEKILQIERKKAEDFITNALNLKENKSEDK